MSSVNGAHKRDELPFAFRFLQIKKFASALRTVHFVRMEATHWESLLGELVKELKSKPDLFEPVIERLRNEHSTAVKFMKAAVLPRESWSDYRGKESPCEFISRVYEIELRAGSLTRASLQKQDPKLAGAYATWIHRHPEDNLGIETHKYVRRTGMVGCSPLSHRYVPVAELSEEDRERRREYFAQAYRRRRLKLKANQP